MTASTQALRAQIEKLITHIVARKRLLMGMEPLDDRAKTVQFARLNELEQLPLVSIAAALDRPETETPEEEPNELITAAFEVACEMHRTCAVCGDSDDSAGHASQPHCFVETDGAAILIRELRGLGFEIVPAATLDRSGGEEQSILRVFEAVVHTYEGDDYMVPADLREASFVRRARKFREDRSGGETLIHWRPFSTAPRDGQHIVAATKFMGEPVVEVIWWAGGEWHGAQGEWRFDAWMPTANLLALLTRQLVSERPRAAIEDVPERTQANTLRRKELEGGETPRENHVEDSRPSGAQVTE